MFWNALLFCDVLDNLTFLGLKYSLEFNHLKFKHLIFKKKMSLVTQLTTYISEMWQGTQLHNFVYSLNVLYFINFIQVS